MTGDAQGQPVEGAVTLSDLAAEMDTPEAEDEAEGEQVEDEAGEAEELDSEEESESEDDAEDEPQDEPTVVLKHDGKEVTLPQSKVIELAQQGFDYTQKTMAVAEERKVVEAERAKVTEVRTKAEAELSETVNRLQAYTQFMETQVGQMPDPAMLAYDTSGYILAKEQYESRKGQLQQAYAEIQRLQNDSARQRQAEIAEKAESTEKVLKDTLPGWNDNTLHELADYAGKAGLDPRTAEQAMLTPGFWQVVNKAKAYDALQEQKAKLKPKSELPKVQKPSAANHPSRGQAKRAEAEKRYSAKPSLNTLADLIE